MLSTDQNHGINIFHPMSLDAIIAKWHILLLKLSSLYLIVYKQDHFLFINRLDTTLRGVAGKSYDGTFNVSAKDRFVIYKNVFATW